MEQNIALFSALPQTIIQLITGNLSMKANVYSFFDFFKILLNLSLMYTLDNLDRLWGS